MMRVTLVGDTSDSRNWGCRATSSALTSLIEQHAEVANRLNIHVLRRTASQKKRKGFARLVQKVDGKLRQWFLGHSLETTLFPLPSVWKDYEAVADHWCQSTKTRGVITALSESDVVVFNGEGAFLGQEVKTQGLFILFLAYLAKTRLCKPCVILNHTADLRHQHVAEIASHVYPLFDDVVVREPFSLENLATVVSGIRPLLAGDAAFTYQPLKGEAWTAAASRAGFYSFYPDSADGFNVKTPYICVGGSAALHPMRRGNRDPTPGYQKLCQALGKLLPVVVTAACEGDEEVMKAVAHNLDLPYLGTSIPTYQAVDVLGNASLYVGGRWHSSILALTGGTPVITMSSNTSYKSQGLRKLMDLHQPEIDALQVEDHVDEIVLRAADYLQQGNSLRNRLETRARQLGQSAVENVRYLRQAA